MFKKAGGFLSSMNPAWRANPLGWLGQSIAVYADQDPFWDKLHRDEADDGFLSRSLKQSSRCIAK